MFIKKTVLIDIFIMASLAFLCFLSLLTYRETPEIFASGGQVIAVCHNF